MNYPLEISFKLLAFARQLSVRDAHGTLLFYVKQKALKLKEEVTVFADAEQRSPLYTMRADRVLDFSASYALADSNGSTLGTIRRRGMRSLWRTHYEIADISGATVMSIREENPWIKVIDSLAGELPVIGMFTGYLFHPAYLVMNAKEQTLLRMRKLPAFFEGKFQVEKHFMVAEAEERLAVLALVMVILLERRRG